MSFKIYNFNNGEDWLLNSQVLLYSLQAKWGNESSLLGWKSNWVWTWKSQCTIAPSLPIKLQMGSYLNFWGKTKNGQIGMFNIWGSLCSISTTIGLDHERKVIYTVNLLGWIRLSTQSTTLWTISRRLAQLELWKKKNKVKNDWIVTRF